MFADAQVIARALPMELPHPLSGKVPQVRAPIVFSATKLDYDRPPPLLGEHTAEVLRDRLSLPPETIADLAARRVIGLRP